MESTESCKRRVVEFTQDDRDMLKAHDLKLEIMCERLNNIEDTMTDGFERIIDKMEFQKDFCSEHREKIHGKYFSKKVLIPVLGLIIISMISIGVYTGKLSSKVDLNIYKICDLTNKLKFEKSGL